MLFFWGVGISRNCSSLKLNLEVVKIDDLVLWQLCTNINMNIYVLQKSRPLSFGCSLTFLKGTLLYE